MTLMSLTPNRHLNWILRELDSVTPDDYSSLEARAYQLGFLISVLSTAMNHDSHVRDIFVRAVQQNHTDPAV
jgi:hypothetical protein